MAAGRAGPAWRHGDMAARRPRPFTLRQRGAAGEGTSELLEPAGTERGLSCANRGREKQLPGSGRRERKVRGEDPPPPHLQAERDRPRSPAAFPRGAACSAVRAAQERQWGRAGGPPRSTGPHLPPGGPTLLLTCGHKMEELVWGCAPRLIAGLARADLEMI